MQARVHEYQAEKDALRASIDSAWKHRLVHPPADERAMVDVVGRTPVLEPYDWRRVRASFEQGGGRGTVGEVDFYQYEHALTRALPLPAAARSKSNAPSTAPHRRDQAQGVLQDLRALPLDRRPHRIGVKVGPSMPTDELVRLLDSAIFSPSSPQHSFAFVNFIPLKEAGRVTLITRYGVGKIDGHLAGHISAVQKSGHGVAAIPCTGSEYTDAHRHANERLGAEDAAFWDDHRRAGACLRIHAVCKSRLGEINLEFTGELNEKGFSSLDVTFNYLKKERRGVKPAEGDVLYTELSRQASG
ncbi:hypothetical protein B0H14DRAFT_3730943 [Mycena olivaceomarginata]|nr:hypothetical protein B0H14DRAFT_3730943 [Mycena olivaceomarginata]